MNTKENLELARRVVTQVRKAGADECAVNVNLSRDIKVKFRDRKLEKLQESNRTSINLSVYAGNRYSNHSTNDLRRDSLDKFIVEAVAMTKYLSKDPYRSLPDPKHYKSQATIDLQLYDSTYEGITSDQRVKIAREIEEAALERSNKIISCTAGFSDSHSATIKVHSNGFEGERLGTSFSAGAEATVKDDDGRRPEGWDGRRTRFLKDLPTPEVMGRLAVDRAISKVSQSKMNSGRYDMVVENWLGWRFLSALYGPMRARSMQQKNSFLEGKLNQKIGSDKLTVIDDPHIETALGSCIFDGEGMATKRRVMIEKGVLKSYYIDWYYGRKLNMEPTIGSTTNVVFDYGTRTSDEMVKDLTRGMLITGFIGGNSNSTTGDFSYGIMGQYVENGKIVQPVNEMNISGNLQELCNQLMEVGGDPYVFSSWRTPSMRFTDVQFSGI